MPRYAIIKNGLVDNIIIAEDESFIPTGEIFVEFTMENPISIGWLYNDGVCTPPAE